MILDLKNYRNRHSLRNKIERTLWHFVWLVAFHPSPRVGIFKRWRIAILKLFGARVAWTSNVMPSCRIWQPWNLAMGEYACLGENVDCYSVDRIVLGDQATVSQGVKLCTASHDIASEVFELAHRPIEIKAGAWVAGWSIVLPGVTVGEGAVIGAGAVVAKNVEPWTVVGGNPAKFIKKRVLHDAANC